jgi:hypothetical protein
VDEVRFRLDEVVELAGRGFESGIGGNARVGVDVVRIF